MWEHFLIALALAMDCLAVSVVCGVLIRKWEMRLVLRLAFFFGLFQALMPLIGWALTTHFSQYLEAIDHWIAFAMLGFIGGKMIWDSFKDEDEPHLNPRGFKTQLAMAVATSIDALAVGITYACTGYNSIRSISLPLGIIGLVSFIMSILGFSLGVRFGEAVNKKMRPELLGGIILMGIGVKILIEHLCA